MSHPELFLRTKVGREHLTPNPAGLEIWGGVECTVNRVGNTYYDQFRTSGHKGRPEDLDAIAELGIRTLRYPILWEHHSGASVDWSWADERMEQLRKLKIEPIIGLVHHGSGPPHTNLLDANFARGLAEHAEAVARRYPWIKYYNPVNEPVTTARFSGLYGHWYPHGRDARTFHRALIVQCQAVREAMRTIRVHNPRAMLIQTEDMGRTYSSAALRYQADFDNSRRWLSLDLLCGRMSPEHPLWGFLVDNGVQQEELESF